MEHSGVKKYRHEPELTPCAKRLRRGMTAEERHLWYDFLRGYPVRFLRQKVLGHAIADFYCAKARLVVELDGSQHYTGTGPLKDQLRTERLEEYGLLVVRIPNNAIWKNFSGVCEHLDELVKQRIGEPAEE